jgi:hypothetical protein
MAVEVASPSSRVTVVVRRLLAVVLVAGCATSHGAIPASAPAERAAQVHAECEESAARATTSGAVPTALQVAGISSLYLIIRGAAHGALIGAATGGSAADGAWIGAAAGAGLGVIIGVGVGVKKGLDAAQRHRAWYEACLADGLSQTADASVPEPETDAAR